MILPHHQGRENLCSLLLLLLLHAEPRPCHNAVGIYDADASESEGLTANYNQYPPSPRGSFII